MQAEFADISENSLYANELVNVLLSQWVRWSEAISFALETSRLD